MAQVELRNVEKTFGKTRVIRDVDLARAQEEAERSGQHDAARAGDQQEEGGLLGRGMGSRGRGLACVRGANRTSYVASLRGYSLRRTRRYLQ